MSEIEMFFSTGRREFWVNNNSVWQRDHYRLLVWQSKLYFTLIFQSPFSVQYFRTHGYIKI